MPLGALMDVTTVECQACRNGAQPHRGFTFEPSFDYPSPDRRRVTLGWH